ncbi:hypothetical protein O4G98_19920 [Zoogloeaceae bacterium G21618-S1]|jgi:hypothetical protein|nr:hypothetical protein [Denitromonas halophila]MCZ4307008.1 hypothetical protein [Zoogloeaceae bacterium G21618-S1]
MVFSLVGVDHATAVIDGCSVRGVPDLDFVDTLSFPWIWLAGLSGPALSE